jgi:Ser/Thr protein kinase RdoA (MazF antagonist)
MEPALRQMIPAAWGVGSTDVHMSISMYVPGRVLESTVSWMRLVKLGGALHEILQAMETISHHGAVVDPDAFRGQTHIDLGAEAEWAFDAIPPPLLAPDQAAVVREAIVEAGRVRRDLQHGDLWPRNILSHEGHWWLLDFDTFGRTQAPLYDAFHLVRSCWALRQGSLQRITRWTQSLCGFRVACPAGSSAFARPQ